MELVENLPLYVGKALGFYTFALLGAQLIHDLSSEKILSQDHLDNMIIEEAENLGISSKNLLGRFYAKHDKDYGSILGARCFIDEITEEARSEVIKVVDIKEGWGARRGAVRHELYHLTNHLPRKKVPKILNRAKQFFYEEPTATLYALTGLKL